MSDHMLKLQILARAEMALIKNQARRMATCIAMYTVSLLFIVLGVCMLNIAGYQALVVPLDPAVAAVLVALADAVVALIIVFISRGAAANTDQEQVVRDIRDLAYRELSTDVDKIKGEVTKAKDDMQRIRSGFTAVTGASPGNLLNNLSPILGLLIGALKKGRNK